MRVKLTTRLIESIEATGERIVLHDTELRGFQCRISPKGKKVFYLYYRTRDGQERRPSLGEFGTQNLEKIRKKAQSWLGRVRRYLAAAVAFIDRFDELKLLKERRETYRGEQDHRRHVGNVTNRYRYFTFSPKAARLKRQANKAK